MIHDKKRLIVDKLGEGCTYDQAATAAGITRLTIWRWIQADPEFAAAVDEARAGPDAEVEAVTFANATDPDPANNTLRMFWLKNRVPQRYREQLDITSKGESLSTTVYVDRADNPRDRGSSPLPPAETT